MRPATRGVSSSAMARFEVEGADLRLVFSWLEMLGGLRSGARVRLSEVESVTVVDDPWPHLRGLRFGTGMPYVIVLGTMLRGGRDDVVAVYGRRPAVIVALRRESRYQRLLATVEEPETVATDIRRWAGLAGRRA